MLTVIAKCVCVLVMAGAVYFYTSDVGRAQIHSVYEKYAKWTQENIDDNPELYLEECGREAQAVLETVEKMESTALRDMAEAKNSLGAAMGRLRIGEEELNTMRALYQGDGMKWPVLWRNRALDKNAYRIQLVHLANDVERQRGLVEKCRRISLEMENRPAVLAAARAEAAGRLAELKAEKESKRVELADRKLVERMLRIRESLDKLQMAAAPNRLLGVEELVRESYPATVPSEEDFLRALGR